MVMLISGNSTVVAVRDQVSADLEGETVILGIGKGMYYAVDKVGMRIWELIGEPATVSTLRDAIVAEFDVDPDACERDLITFLEDLESESLIQVASDADR